MSIPPISVPPVNLAFTENQENTAPPLKKTSTKDTITPTTKANSPSFFRKRHWGRRKTNKQNSDLSTKALNGILNTPLKAARKLSLVTLNEGKISVIDPKIAQALQKFSYEDLSEHKLLDELFAYFLEYNHPELLSLQTALADEKSTNVFLWNTVITNKRLKDNFRKSQPALYEDTIGWLDVKSNNPEAKIKSDLFLVFMQDAFEEFKQLFNADKAPIKT